MACSGRQVTREGVRVDRQDDNINGWPRHMYSNMPSSAVHNKNAHKPQLDMQPPAKYYSPRPPACWQNPPPSAGSAVLPRMQTPTPLWGRTTNAAWQLPPVAVITVAGPPDLSPDMLQPPELSI